MQKLSDDDVRLIRLLYEESKRLRDKADQLLEESRKYRKEANQLSVAKIAEKFEASTSTVSKIAHYAYRENVR